VNDQKKDSSLKYNNEKDPQDVSAPSDTSSDDDSGLEDIFIDPYVPEENDSKKSEPKSERTSSVKKTPGISAKPNSVSHKKKRRKKKFAMSRLNIILLGLILLILVISVVKLLIWNVGKKVDPLDPSAASAFNTESMDSIVPLNSTDPNSKRSNKDDQCNVLFLGNNPLSDGRNSSDGLVSLIKSKTGGTVYNCSISESFMANKNKTYSHSYPTDAYSFYDICTFFTVGNTETLSWAKDDLKTLPSDVQNAMTTLKSIDYSKLDAICIYYDASDYLQQRVPYSDKDTSDVTTYAGALESGVKLIQKAYPNVRIIVMSPTYAYYVDKNGKYISSFNTSVASYPLYIYTIHEQDASYRNNVSFVDNFYGTIYEEVAKKYLSDSLHVNADGRKLLANRFVYALNRFNDYKFPSSRN